jgi:hypothetical protein
MLKKLVVLAVAVSAATFSFAETAPAPATAPTAEKVAAAPKVKHHAAKKLAHKTVHHKADAAPAVVK